MKRALAGFAALMTLLMLMAIGYGMTGTAAEAQQSKTYLAYYPNVSWSSSQTYAVGDTITTGGATYISNVYPNIANNPSSTTTGYCVGFAVPCWTAIGGGGGGGSYLPLAGGTLTGPIGEVSQTLTGTDANNINVPASSTYAHIFDQSTFALSPVTSGNGSQVQSVRTVTGYGPGLSIGGFDNGGWRVMQNTYLGLNLFAARGIDETIAGYSIKHAIGDFTSDYLYGFSDGGSTGAGDQGITLSGRNGGETSGYYHGTISTTTGTGDTAPVLSTATSGNNWTTDGAILLDISKGTISGNYNGASTPFGSTYLNQIPVTNTLPLSTAWGTLTANIGNPGVPASSTVTNTYTVTLGTIGSSAPSFVAGKICMAGPNFLEQAVLSSPGVASGGTQTITLTYRNPNGYSTTYPILFEGGVCGQYISEDANLTYSGYRTTYSAIGAVTTGNLIYAVGSHSLVASQTLPMASEAQTTTSGYHLYPGAEVVENTTTGVAPILEPNNVAWAAGDTIENPHSPIVNTVGLFMQPQQYTPANNSGSAGAFINMVGSGVAGLNYIGMRLTNTNPCTAYSDCGATITAPASPYAGLSIEGYWQNGIKMQYGPSSGNAAFTIGSTFKNDGSPYGFFTRQNGTNAGEIFGFNPTSNYFTFNRPIYVSGCSSGQYIKGDGTGCGSPGGGTTTNAVTFAATGGAAPGTTFNGSAAVTVDPTSVGLPSLASVATTPASGGPIAPRPTGQVVPLQKIANLYVFGDSYHAETGVYNEGDGIVGLLKRDVPAPIYNYAIGGQTTPQYVQKALANFIPSQLFPNVTINSGAENDAADDTCSACANAITHFKNSLNALIYFESIPFSNRKMASTATQTTGTWAAATNVPLSSNYQFASPGTDMYATVSGDVLTYTVSTGTGVTKLGYAYDVCNLGASCGNFTLTIDGTAETDACSGTTTFATQSCVSFANSQTEGVYRQEYSVTPAATHTVVVTMTSSQTVISDWVDWPVSGSASNNIVFGTATNAYFNNYAAYNTAAATVYAQALADGLPVYYTDVVNGVTVNGTTYTVNATTDISTTATATCSASQLAGHPNTCGAEHYREAYQAEEYVSGVVFGSPNLVSSAGSTGSLSFPGPLAGKMSMSNNGTNGVITAAATIPLVGTYSIGGYYEITGATTITTITPPPLCIRNLTYCIVNFVADSALNFGTGGNLSQAFTIASGSAFQMLYEQPNATVAAGKWYPLTPNGFLTTATNCSSSASPAVCSAAAAGSATVAASATTEVVNTTAVTANSQIIPVFDSSLGTKLGVTCNTTFVQPYVTARTAGTSFTVTVGTAPTANPACFSYVIVN